MSTPSLNRRTFLGQGLATAVAASTWPVVPTVAADSKQALISITLDLEMSRNFPEWEMTHWDFEKGNLSEATKLYAVRAAERVKAAGGVIHFFCVGRALEQEQVDWLININEAGHPIGNHTYDHVYLLAKTAEELQFRFRRAPWLLRGMSVPDAIADNIALTRTALKTRCGITERGFRTPGGFATGLRDREDVQRLLLDQGYRWVSSLYPPHKNTTSNATGRNPPPPRDVLDDIVRAVGEAQPFRYPTGLVEVPMSPISDIGAFRTGRWKLDEFIEAVTLGVERAIAEGLCYDFLAHPSCLGVVDPEFKTIDAIVRLVQKAGSKARLVGLDELAARVPA
jgi:peptidoglycan/xylan/chitin deacetylase (PgdA/CDA1 family)